MSDRPPANDASTPRCDSLRVIGVVGGIGSGKSEVARRLGELGALVIDVDRVGHEVLEDADVKEALCARWGPTILTSDGRIDRRLVSERVFAREQEAQQERSFLESVVHPRIGQRLGRILECARHQVPGPVVVLDAALLFEAGWDRYCDEIIFVDAPEDVRRRRALGRGWSVAEWRAREAAQLPLEEKRRRATVVLVNAGTLDDLRQSVDRWWYSRRSCPTSGPPQ